MKFLCKTEFFHSGVRLYTSGTVYGDITAKVAEELIAADRNIPLGALSFFAPVDEEAVKFVKDRKGKEPTDQTVTTTTAPKQPTRAELVAEAKALGINKANTMKNEDLLQAVEAAKKERQQDAPTSEGGTEPPTVQG
jgi:hypothetical protein